jgi:hypothetical protein
LVRRHALHARVNAHLDFEFTDAKLTSKSPRRSLSDRIAASASGDYQQRRIAEQGERANGLAAGPCVG